MFGAPYSRFAPHFNRRSLSQLLDKEGIQYMFAGKVLGGETNRSNLLSSGGCSGREGGLSNARRLSPPWHVRIGIGVG